MIDSRAIVSDEARIDPSVKIGPFAIIEGEVEIGRGTVIGPHAVIKGPCRIGEDNEIFQFAVVGEVPQDLKFRGEHSLLEIGDRNRIREFSSLHRGTEGGGGLTRIGSDNLLMAYTHVAHDCQIGNQVILANAASLAGHVVVEDHAILGGFAVVHQFCRIGAHAFIGGATKITQDVAPYVMVDGARARAVSLNKEGLRRRGFGAEELAALHKAFKWVVKSRPVDDAQWAELDRMAESSAAVAHLLDFVRNSERGIVR
ncbi:MAG: acyl-ACP--UDP-N-acetylglucosamine O-acyltransferase [Halothiobacillaceae bacterium]